MPTSPDGALGSLDYKKEERQTLVVKSCETTIKLLLFKYALELDYYCCETTIKLLVFHLDNIFTEVKCVI